jgi:signal transduction histidine kinase
MMDVIFIIYFLVSEVNFEIFCRIKEGNGEEVEFIFNDVTRTKIIEKSNAEFAYKAVFLSKVAHEFKNPLICISELVEQIKDELPYISDHTHLERVINLIPQIKSLSNYLLVLVKDLDYFSLNQIKKEITLEKSNFEMKNLLTFCSDIANSLLAKLGKKGYVEFKINVDKNASETLFTDEWRLKQALINLISNSIKFTQYGIIELIVKCEHNIDEEGFHNLSFCVKDSGIGIDALSQENLIKPFSKGLQNTNSLGAGLGLTIVNDITSKLGKAVQFSSEYGKGSLFWFSLPCIEKHNNRTKKIELYNNLNCSARSNETIKVENFYCNEISQKISFKTYQPIQNINQNYKINITNNITNFQNKENSSENISLMQLDEYDNTILIVDDEAINQQSVIRLLSGIIKDFGIKVNILKADDGMSALYEVYKCYKKGIKISFILSDETMTYINGIKFAKIINNINNAKKLPVIPFYLITAYEDPTLICKSQKMFVNKIFSKPLDKNLAEKFIIEHFAIIKN